jgi:hypothetical protein
MLICATSELGGVIEREGGGLHSLSLAQVKQKGVSQRLAEVVGPGVYFVFIFHFLSFWFLTFSVLHFFSFHFLTF